ncbi:hypothetical protein BHM03_00009760 [Ensete ventricosum]|uniref:Uncharacterized protein n=1 Tax=Ensete ventricosum TaxID=4639 RepID=A0A445MCV6_ENSVE|nr:hypothetical protein BHM03_00009760 [Ensete ventricosum]
MVRIVTYVAAWRDMFRRHAVVPVLRRAGGLAEPSHWALATPRQKRALLVVTDFLGWSEPELSSSYRVVKCPKGESVPHAVLVRTTGRSVSHQRSHLSLLLPFAFLWVLRPLSFPDSRSVYIGVSYLHLQVSALNEAVAGSVKSVFKPWNRRLDTSEVGIAFLSLEFSFPPPLGCLDATSVHVSPKDLARACCFGFLESNDGDPELLVFIP